MNTAVHPNMAVPAHTEREHISTPGRLFIAVLLISVLEGAVRKWVFPSASMPLVLLRDLLVIYTIYWSVRHGDLRRQPKWSQPLLGWSLGVAGWGLLQLTMGESSFPVLLIGLRFWLLYIWFAVAAASSMSARDFRASLFVLLALMVFMTPLVLLQHYSPPGAFINLTPDASEEDVFVVIAGVVRTTGTFTFTAGYTLFLALCTPFALGILETPKRTFFQRLLALAVFVCLLASAFVAGARSVVIVTGAMLALYLVSTILVSPLRNKAMAIFTAVLVLLMVIVLASVFESAVEATQQRFETASEAENIFERIASAFFGGPDIYSATWIGAGIGRGSNLAQFVVSGTQGSFVLGETEPGRIILEGGLVGWLFVIFKYLLILLAVGKSLLLAVRTRSAFPILLWAMLSVALVTWQMIGQLTAHALFGVLFAFGLLSFRYPGLRWFK